METNLLLESHLKTLRLATFREQYRQVAKMRPATTWAMTSICWLWPSRK